MGPFPCLRMSYNMSTIHRLVVVDDIAVFIQPVISLAGLFVDRIKAHSKEYFVVCVALVLTELVSLRLMTMTSGQALDTVNPLPDL